MNKEEKKLLLIDFAARLPYGVVYHRNDGANIKLYDIDVEHGYLNYTDNIEERECKPYLRPMSSMTKEEKEEICKICDIEYIDNGFVNFGLFPSEGGLVPIYTIGLIIEWLLKKHFDFMGLIGCDLAIPVTKENNPYKE